LNFVDQDERGLKKDRKKEVVTTQRGYGQEKKEQKRKRRSGVVQKGNSTQR